ncbi:cupin domain-containing protein [Paraburkholderia sp. B3]|uniref:cupin domain-containing protein n=1 Tax=Paraburkholderia sp. B3 TaxID=3134791 RepID=UPI0039825894
MLVNADFSRRVTMTPADYRWIASPQGGVERMMLDRLGGERARATSIVRYAPASRFSLHEHPGGEEIFVLSGVFSEGRDHYPSGWYLRNPPGSSHQPYSLDGAIIFVKLWQMPPTDSERVRVDTNARAAWQRRGRAAVCPLFSGDTEQVSLHRLPPREPLFDGEVGTAELLVLAGAVKAGRLSCKRGTWIRLPAGEYPEFSAGESGALFYIKTGHLTEAGLKG